MKRQKSFENGMPTLYLVATPIGNLKEMNELIAKLRKPQQEEKSYEDMTKEELIEELKKK